VSRGADGRSSIHRRPDGHGWEGWVSLGAHPLTRARWRKHVRGATKTEVAGKMAALERALDAGAVAVDHASTLNTWMEAWLSGRVIAGLRPTR
jgi:hypothetical protein